MLFNSLQFLLFYVIITILYWQIPNRYRWLLLLVGSCYFYMAFVPIYIVILGFTIVVDYFAGRALGSIRTKRTRRAILVLSLIANVGILAVFKYYNFFNEALGQFIGGIASEPPLPLLNILLPIGLSFHTFQAMSYTIEVYRGNQKAERHFGIYALYVMFYPQLVAGPIERPQNVLPQFHSDHKYCPEDMKIGLMQMAFGFFKKVVIADRLALFVDPVYANPDQYSSTTILVATIFYSFQIYCDFSGYSDIGIGAARTMGYRLMTNFNMPYLSRSIGEFWTRWHISLSTWFRDYLYIPLGGNRVSFFRWCCNIMIVFLVSGLWHGASWSFVIWGALHGSFLILERVKDRFLAKLDMQFDSNVFMMALQTLITFSLVTIAWVFFRSESIDKAILIYERIFSGALGSSTYFAISQSEMIFSFMLIFLLFLMERNRWAIRQYRGANTFYFRFASLTFMCYFLGVFSNNQFIYFQF